MNKILVTRSSLPPIDDFISEINGLWDSHWLTNMGDKHQKLQSLLMDYLGVECLDLLVNGHMALELSLQAMELPTGGEVITTPFSFASTTHAIVRNGLVPVFCDITEDDYTIDVTQIEKMISKNTCAIMPVHVYGNVCDVEAIEEIAQRHNLKVIYDAAHAFGEKYKGKSVASFGDASCFSFHATKVFNTIEGGAVCHSNRELGRKIYNLKNFGIRDAETVEAVGANAKMNEFCAAMGICNLKYLAGEIEKRRCLVEQYRQRLSNIDGIKLCKEQEDVEYNYSYFPVVFDKECFGKNRDEIVEILAKNGIGARKYFYPLISDFECYREKYNSDLTPVAQRVSQNVLTLPLYAELSIDEVNRICDIIVGKSIMRGTAQIQ